MDDWIPGWRTMRPEAPIGLAIIWQDRIFDVEWYGTDVDGEYFKTKMPGGGTIEVHLLREDYFR